MNHFLGIIPSYSWSVCTSLDDSLKDKIKIKPVPRKLNSINYSMSSTPEIIILKCILFYFQYSLYNYNSLSC